MTNTIKQMRLPIEKVTIIQAGQFLCEVSNGVVRDESGSIWIIQTGRPGAPCIAPVLENGMVKNSGWELLPFRDERPNCLSVCDIIDHKVLKPASGNNKDPNKPTRKVRKQMRKAGQRYVAGS